MKFTSKLLTFVGMATPPKWRFHFYDTKDSVYVYVDDNGAIQTTSDSVVGLANPLRDACEDWLKITTYFERSIDSAPLHGIFTKLTGEFTLYGDAAKIIRYYVYTKGYSGELRFIIYERNDSDWGYSLYQEGDINFEKPTDTLTDIKVNLFEKGIGQDLKTFMSTDYEIPIDSDAIDVYFAGTRVKGRYNYRHAGTPARLAWPSGLGISHGIYFNLITVNTTSEGFKPVAVIKNAEPASLGEYIDTLFYGDNEYQQYIFKNVDTQPINTALTYNDVVLKWKYTDYGGAPTVDARLEMFFIITKQNEDRSPEIVLHSGSLISLTSGTEYTESVVNYYSIYGDIDPEECIFLCAGIYVDSGSPVPNGLFEVWCEPAEDSRIIIDVDFQTTPSSLKAFRQPTMWDKLIKKIADGNYGASPAASTFLNNASLRLVDNYPYHTCYVNGYEIKNPNNGSIFKVSLKDILKDLQAKYPCGVGVKDNVVSLEHLSYFYDKFTRLGDLGELTNARITPMDKMGANLIFGYKFKDGDVLNGMDDYNTEIKYRSRTKFSEDRTIEFTSPCHASIYDIEGERVEGAGKATTGNKINDELFTFSVYPNDSPPDTWFLNVPNVMGGVVSGVYFPDTAYNVDLSPARNKERLLPLISSYCYPSTEGLKYQTSARNGLMVSKFQDTTPGTYTPEITENADLIPTSSDRLFLPFIVEAEAIIPIDIDTIMQINPYGYFDATIDGVAVEIFIDRIPSTPADRSSFDIKGRFTPNVDITKLIK